MKVALTANGCERESTAITVSGLLDSICEQVFVLAAAVENATEVWVVTFVRGGKTWLVVSCALTAHIVVSVPKAFAFTACGRLQTTGALPPT